MVKNLVNLMEMQFTESNQQVIIKIVPTINSIVLDCFCRLFCRQLAMAGMKGKGVALGPFLLCKDAFFFTVFLSSFGKVRKEIIQLSCYCVWLASSFGEEIGKYPRCFSVLRDTGNKSSVFYGHFACPPFNRDMCQPKSDK